MAFDTNKHLGKGRRIQIRNSFLGRRKEEREYTLCNPPQHLFQGGLESESLSFFLSFFLDSRERKRNRETNIHTFWEIEHTINITIMTNQKFIILFPVSVLRDHDFVTFFCVKTRFEICIFTCLDWRGFFWTKVIKRRQFLTLLIRIIKFNCLITSP